MKVLFSALTIIGFIFSSCDSEKGAPLPDINPIKVDFELVRFDQEVMSMDTNHTGSAYDKLLVKHPMMTDLYFKRLLPLHKADRDSLSISLKDFLTDKRITNLAAEVNKQYASTKDIESELTTALKYYKHYFPRRGIPRFYTLFTEFGYQNFIFTDHDGRDAIGIGLDMFLGDDFDYRKVNPSDPVFSDYLARTYNKVHLPKKAMEMLINDAIGDPPGKRFIDQMIHQGKKIYLLKKVLPTTSDNVIHEYNPEQMDWVQKNELPIWSLFLEEDLMYDTNPLKLSKFLHPAPSTKGMPAASPGRTAEYMGYVIVEAYMKKYPETTMKELIEARDSQLLLEQSKYKPPRK